MKSGDLGLTILIILLFLVFYLFNILTIGIQNIKDNWIEYRCNPSIMPFASIVGPNGINASENFTYCIQNMQSSYMSFLLQPVNYNIGVIGETAKGLSESLNSSREFFNKLRNMITDTISSIFSVFLNIIIEFQRIIIDIKDLFAKLVGILVTMMYVLDGSIKTMNSTWNGPPGKLVRALGKCFHPDTKIQLQSGKYIKMKDVKLGEILKNGSIVEGVMMLHNLDEHKKYIDNYYVILGGENNKDIYVTGSHLIYNKDLNDFQQVCYYPHAIPSNHSSEYFSCLITNNHIIQIGNNIFHDWEDNNGSISKK